MSTYLFDRVYQTDNLFFGDTPSVFLTRFLDEFPLRGSALEIGCGEGRDTVPMLERGLNVTAIDRSEVGIAKLWKRIESRTDLKDLLKTQVCDILSYEWPKNSFDLIVAVTLLDHLSKREILVITQKMTDALKIGGTLFIEVHSDRDPAITLKGPKSELSLAIKHYFGGNELLNLFAPSNRILVYVDRVEWDYDHGLPHQHGFISLIAQKNSKTRSRRNML